MKRNPRLLSLLVVALACGTSAGPAAAASAAGFSFYAAGTANASALPRELRAAPVCSEKPAYTRAAYRKDLEGLTVLRATVDPTGRIRVITLYHASGDTSLYRELDDAASSALASCHWDVVSPASFDHPVDVDAYYRWVKAEHGDDF